MYKVNVHRNIYGLCGCQQNSKYCIKGSEIKNLGISYSVIDCVLGLFVNKRYNLHITRLSSTFDNVNESTKNRTINTNLTILNMSSERWTNSYKDIDVDRFNKISKTDHFKLVRKFIDKVSYLDHAITQKMIVYSGSALVLHGITYTNDIDILIFGMTFREIKEKIWNKLPENITKHLDICTLSYRGVFLAFEPDKDEYNASVHHNNGPLMQILDMESPFKKVYPKYGNIGIEEFDVAETNNFYKGSVVVGGVNVFGLELMEIFYTCRYNVTFLDTRFLVILDMYLLILYAKSRKFCVKIHPSDNDLEIFKRSFEKYEKMPISNAKYIAYSSILKFE